MSSIYAVLSEVGAFWKSRAFRWWTRKKPQDVLLSRLDNAQTYEEWEDAAFQLDDLLGTDLWRQNASSKFYDYRLINERLQAILDYREEEDILGLVNLLRSGLLRNLGNITAPRLFNRAYAGTKLLIEAYITQVALAIDFVTAIPTNQNSDSGWTLQAKLDLLHDTRQAFGRSTLVLQGGATFGLCHLGVVKALHLRGLMPRIITGTATGALIAALVSVHTDDELLEVLSGEGIDLTAFTRYRRQSSLTEEHSLISDPPETYIQTIVRRVNRYLHEGYFLDVTILEECVRANVGNLTFEEAYSKTGRVLNITVATSGGGGIPSVLNYVTTPNVLIWSAALASNSSGTKLFSPVILKCKDETGAIIPWASANEITFRSWKQASYHGRESPLSRIAELFNVNHFIVSQARPYIAPFLRSDLQHPNPRQAGRRGWTTPVLRLVTLEVHHRLSQLDSLGFLLPIVRRLIIDQNVPGASITLLPDLSPADFLKVIETPTKETVDYWVLRGERSVWPAVGSLKVRCAVEIEIDRCYQLIRRKKPLSSYSPQVNTRSSSRGDTKDRRKSAASLGGNDDLRPAFSRTISGSLHDRKRD
ncbi:hypothetical protein MMC12_008396 [Toensbergia leucococca]|nr:hypothetical protein [Toensbergia leucococca]